MPDEQDREESHLEDEQIEQQDLNQGMDTGTHSTERLGVNWPASYRRKMKAPKPKGNAGKQGNDKK